MPLSNPLTSGTYNYAYAIATTLTPVTGATDVLTISGSATPRNIVVSRLAIYGTATVGVGLSVSVVMRSTPNTGGSPTTIIPTPYDSAVPPSNAVVQRYATNPTLGTVIGSLTNNLMALQVATNVPQAYIYEWPFGLGIYGPVLRTANDTLAINLGGAVIVGGNLAVTVEWCETPP